MRKLILEELDLVIGGDGITAANFKVTGNPSAGDIANLNAALAYLQTSSEGASLVEQAASVTAEINIVHNGADDYGYHQTTGAPVAQWDPNAALAVNDPEDLQNNEGVQSAAIGLAHELAHFTDPTESADERAPDPDYGNVAEQKATAEEDKVADQLGEPDRYDHADAPVVNEDNPTEHTTTDAQGNSHWTETGSDGQQHNFGPYDPHTAAPKDAPQDGDPTDTDDGSESGDSDGGDGDGDSGGDGGDDGGDDGDGGGGGGDGGGGDPGDDWPGDHQNDD